MKSDAYKRHKRSNYMGCKGSEAHTEDLGKISGSSATESGINLSASEWLHTKKEHDRCSVCSENAKANGKVQGRGNCSFCVDSQDALSLEKTTLQSAEGWYNGRGKKCSFHTILFNSSVIINISQSTNKIMASSEKCLHIY